MHSDILTSTFLEHNRQLKSFLLRITASAEDAEDIMQDTYIKAAEKISTQKRWTTYGYVGLKLGATITGIGNGADKYVPVIVQNPSTFKYHFGWLRVNLSSDFKTFKVIDGAYNIIAETPIAMGAK